MGRRRFDDAEPFHSGPDAGPALGMDDALVEALGGHEQLGEELGHRAVPGGLRGDLEAVAGGEADRLDDVVRGSCRKDSRGTHRDGDVPGRDEGVVRPVTGDGDRTGREGVQLGEGRVGREEIGAGVGEGHGSSVIVVC